MFSPSPRPMTSGGPCFAAMIVPGSSRGDHHQRVVALELLERLLHRVDERRAVLAVLLDQVRDDFRVGLALELVALRLAAAA